MRGETGGIGGRKRNDLCKADVSLSRLWEITGKRLIMIMPTSTLLFSKTKEQSVLNNKGSLIAPFFLHFTRHHPSVFNYLFTVFSIFSHYSFTSSMIFSIFKNLILSLSYFRRRHSTLGFKETL